MKHAGKLGVLLIAALLGTSVTAALAQMSAAEHQRYREEWAAKEQQEWVQQPKTKNGKAMAHVGDLFGQVGAIVAQGRAICAAHPGYKGCPRDATKLP